MTVDPLSLAREFREVLRDNSDRSDRFLADRLVAAVRKADVEYESFSFVAVNRHGRQPSIRATFRYAEDCRRYAESHKFSAETRDGRKLVQNYDRDGFAHGTKILDILDGK